jgi:hypothetical protein
MEAGQYLALRLSARLVVLELVASPRRRCRFKHQRVFYCGAVASARVSQYISNDILHAHLLSPVLSARLRSIVDSIAQTVSRFD